jgi:hypothetical protein
LLNLTIEGCDRTARWIVNSLGRCSTRSACHTQLPCAMAPVTRVIDSSAARCHSENSANTIAASRANPPATRNRGRPVRSMTQPVATSPMASSAAGRHVIQKLGTTDSLPLRHGRQHRPDERSADGPDRDVAHDGRSA